MICMYALHYVMPRRQGKQVYIIATVRWSLKTLIHLASKGSKLKYVTVQSCYNTFVYITRCCQVVLLGMTLELLHMIKPIVKYNGMT
jgi:hypothetical protein